MELWQILGALHPKLVQFPLVLLLSGLLFDACGLLRRARRLHWAGLILTTAGTMLLLLAFICGIYAEVWAGRAGVSQDAIEWHEFMANIASWGFVILAAWRLLLNPRSRRTMAIYLALGLSWYVLLALTAYLGGQLVFTYGAAVTSGSAGTVISLHDLNTLAVRQTDLNLRYSQMMHHIFGWLTLALSASLLMQALFPGPGRKRWWLAPALLLAGGVFLFFCADLDLYRLTDLRQLRDREVQLHKTIAVALVLVGAAGLRWSGGSDDPQSDPQPAQDPAEAMELAASPTRRPRTERDSAPPSPVAESPPHAPPRRPIVPPSKLIAIMALIGGGMLFTHVHTVAPYANVAAGVYIYHVALGSVALAIGSARLMQDALPRHRRGLAAAFALLLCVESVLLITYNEGLPWFIGYGSYNRWGSHKSAAAPDGGTIAPFGPLRAELTFDNDSQQLDVFVMDRFKNTPVTVPARSINLLIARGYQEIAVPMRAQTTAGSAAGGTAIAADHFSAKAPWMRNIPAFCARVALLVNGSMRMGYFDPWVAPLVRAVPPNELAQYQCPMHDGVLSTQPGNCPLCGMALVPIQYGPRLWLHREPYGLDLRVGHEPPQTADASSASAASSAAGPSDELDRLLVFSPLRQGKLMEHLPVVHEHPLHLTIVSRDLSFFDHVHPLPQADGTLQLRYHFPRPGQYVLFGEYNPMGARNQIFRFPLTAGVVDSAESRRSGGGSGGSDELLQPVDCPTAATDAANLVPDPTLAKPLADDPDLTARLVTDPRTLTAGTHATLLFHLEADGQPVTDLQPYMGAAGHCAIISADTRMMIHCHPEQLYPATGDDHGGPDVPFHAVFPTPGRYKIWGQFRRDGRVVIADFVVDVSKPLLPARVVNVILNDY